MIVEQIMKTNIFTLHPNSTITDAINLVKQKRIRHIPIVDEEQRILGIVTDRDIRDASPSIFHAHEHLEDFEKPISTLMKTDVITGHPLDFVEEIAALFYEHRISCLPIETDGKLVGMVTETDLLYTLVQLTGAHQPGSQIEVKVPNYSGMLSEVAAVFAKRNMNISSVLVYPDSDERYKILVFRIQTMNPTGIIADLKNAGYAVLWPNLPGVSS
ncbi:acetoin utilization AcuB family protein [Anoxybacillus rupiensis]|uniref:Acetoin utilization AcuB family protein n=1 Tax=Anoxybacteroides rupiense TaxID=311460 RepID=A0ABD5IUV9_9BACL|nr:MULTISPECIES: acetoin utilization AcuB family protein [Anoxybacillus]MBB3907032.1 acetoin utilization protein AcuB [Anoxybacillus rupiensis]MBS2771440.1 acetoin utilization AcuB family protein [Anoxybacillus rupiensis]MDE8564717.1 acetoin utilization AcuB family protein [Anoxybacillus rupiensis]MED5051181.1 acetoin utilization AcuB family protein [Anoxybacillus rupiensis]QHC05087.1 CBS domain-containing protein [Anoxybacillus sp. PDR2]